VAEISFSNEEREAICQRIQQYFEDEMANEIGQFEAGFLLDFFAGEIGAYFYNRGLFDAQAIFESRLEHIAEAVYELEKPTPFAR
jgi:uncharacterized protein (DUF2164 family)